MKLSNKYRKMNRGLLLGGILVLIVVLYTIVTALTFQFQKSDIREVVSDFVNEATDLHTEEGTEAEKKESFAKILSKYTTQKGVATESSYDRSQMQDAYAEFLANVHEDVKVNEIDVRFDSEDPDKNFYITRAGVSYAKVMLNVRVDCEMDMPQSMYEYGVEFGSILYMPGSVVEKIDYKEFEGEEEDKVRHYSGSFNYDVTIIMEKSGGEWKVSAVEGVYLNGNMMEERTTGGNYDE